MIREGRLSYIFHFFEIHVDVICFAEEHDLEDDECYAGHDPKDDPDETIEDQEHQEDNGRLECGVFIDSIELSEDIVADPHIDGGIVFERLIDEVLLVGIDSLDECGSGWLFCLDGYILPDGCYVFDFGVEQLSGICLEFLYARSDRTRESINDAIGGVWEILAGEREFGVVSEDEEAIADSDENGEHISSGIEIAQSVPFYFVIWATLEEPSEIYDTGIDGKHREDESDIAVSDIRSFQDRECEHQECKIFDRQFTDLEIEEMEEKEEKHDIEHGFDSEIFSEEPKEHECIRYEAQYSEYPELPSMQSLFGGGERWWSIYRYISFLHLSEDQGDKKR